MSEVGPGTDNVAGVSSPEPPRATVSEHGRRRMLRGLLPHDRRYLVLAAVLLTLLIAQTLRQQWSSDMWGVHVATVREQIAHLTNPRNPLLVANDPFPYFSPYTTAVAAVAKLLGIGPIGALQVAAIANAVLFLWAFERFVTRLLGDARVAFYGLLFTLLLWGFTPFRTSGFLDLNALGFVLPYPAMFADGMALVALGSLVAFLRGGSRWQLVIVVASAALVLTSHPLTASWLAVVSFALVVSNWDRARLAILVQLSVAAAAVAGLAAAWPLYPVFSLVGKGSAFSAGNSALYADPLLATFLALPGLWFLWQRSRGNWRDPIVLMFVAGLALYLFGWVTNDQAYGRALVPVMLALQLALAAKAVSVEAAIRGRHQVTDRDVPILALGVVALLVGSVGAAPAVAHILPTSVRPSTTLDNVPGQFQFLQVVPVNAVVVAQPGQLPSIAEPAFGGKLLSSDEPLPPGPTTKTDVAVTKQFFAPNTPGTSMLKLIERYRIDYVVSSRATARQLAERSQGTIIGCSSKWSLISTQARPRDDDCYRPSPA